MALGLLLNTNQAVILKLEKTGKIICQSQKAFGLGESLFLTWVSDIFIIKCTYF